MPQNLHGIDFHPTAFPTAAHAAQAQRHAFVVLSSADPSVGQGTEAHDHALAALRGVRLAGRCASFATQTTVAGAFDGPLAACIARRQCPAVHAELLAIAGGCVTVQRSRIAAGLRHYAAMELEQGLTAATGTFQECLKSMFAAYEAQYALLVQVRGPSGPVRMVRSITGRRLVWKERVPLRPWAIRRFAVLILMY